MLEPTLLTWTHRLDRTPVALRVAIIATVIGAVALVDDLTGPNLTMTLPYSLCVMAASWTISRNAGFTAAVVAALLGAALRLAESDVDAGVVVANAGLRLVSFLLFALLTAGMRRSFADLADTARRDPMTGVLSRQGFLDELSRLRRTAQRQGTPIGVVYFDLDGLKVVNDQHGHAAGDALIRRFVDRVGRHLRTSDVFGRLGGDEFALVLERAEPDVIDAIVGRVLSDPGLPETSCGVAVFTDSYPPPARMLAGADRRMYRDKQVRKGTIPSP